MNYNRDFEVQDMVVVVNPCKGTPHYSKGDLGFIASLADDCGVAWVYFDTSNKCLQRAVCYEEIEKFNPEKDYRN